jgi:hypothetical protein
VGRSGSAITSSRSRHRCCTTSRCGRHRDTGASIARTCFSCSTPRPTSTTRRSSP